MCEKAPFDPLDLIVIFLLAISAASLALLASGHFATGSALLLGLPCAAACAFLLLRRKRRYRLRIPPSSSTAAVISLLLLGAIFRVEPYDWIAGGQDQGTYVNMSSFFQDQGRVFGSDELRNSIPDEYKRDYDAANYGLDDQPHTQIEPREKGRYVPGVYVSDQSRSEYVFQFYHLHSLWMAMFADVLGNDMRVYSLVFFGLLSIVAFYLLAREFTGSTLLAWSAGALLAMNPLHAFFSKFPVTEVVALAFSTLAFYYLLRYYNRAKRGQHCALYLVLSSLSLGCMFFTRISGFMYMPFFYLLLLLVELYAKPRVMRNQLTLYVLSVFFIYLLSVLYGFKFSYPYVTAIYQSAFSKALGGSWSTVLSAGCVAALLGYGVIAWLNRHDSASSLRAVAVAVRSYIPYVFLLFLLLGAYKVYQLGFTTLGGDGSFRREVAGTRWHVLLYWSPVVLLEYLSPFIGILFVSVAFFKRRKLDLERTLLLVFILLFFAYVSVLQWFIPYQYYYARYLLSEALPYMLLFSVIGISTLSRRKPWAYALLILSGVYMATFSATQFRGKDMDGLRQSLDQLSTYVKKDDILLVGPQWVWSVHQAELKMPLKFYYNYDVISTGSRNPERFVDYYCSTRELIYYLGGEQTQGLGTPLKILEMKAEVFEHAPYIPTKVIEQSINFGLFRVDCGGWNRYRASLGKV